MKSQNIPGTKAKKLLERDFKYCINEGLQMLKDAIPSAEVEA
jgi:hypothetical protein